jgi:hypothetical protein
MEPSSPTAPFNFYLNKAFWKKWGWEASVPFRLKNLKTVVDNLQRCGTQVWLFGGTLRDALAKGYLGNDHDDDLVVDVDNLSELRKVIFDLTDEFGFEVIRDLPDLISIARFERYIDIHPNVDQFTDGPVLRVNGYQFPTFVESDKYVREKYQTSEKINKRRPLLTRGMRIASRTAARALRAAAELFENKKAPHRTEIVELSKEQFLGLRFDPPGSLNWTWRGSHFSKVAREGETIGQAISWLAQVQDEYLERVTETDLSQCVPEPVNLSRRFWQSGDNYFAYPLVYGLAPMLFGREYYEHLPKMSDDEISLFLRNNPVEISNGSLTSGRHRAAAMMGRIMRGEPYVPIFALKA